MLDPDTHVGAIRPGMGGERALDGDSRRDGVGGAAEGDEEGVALCVDLLTPMPGERFAQQPLLVGEQFAVAGAAKLFQQAGGALDVREQEGDGAA